MTIPRMAYFFLGFGFGGYIGLSSGRGKPVATQQTKPDLSKFSAEELDAAWRVMQTKPEENQVLEVLIEKREENNKLLNDLVIERLGERREEDNRFLGKHLPKNKLTA